MSSLTNFYERMTPRFLFLPKQTSKNRIYKERTPSNRIQSHKLQIVFGKISFLWVKSKGYTQTGRGGVLRKFSTIWDARQKQRHCLSINHCRYLRDTINIKPPIFFFMILMSVKVTYSVVGVHLACQCPLQVG